MSDIFDVVTAGIATLSASSGSWKPFPKEKVFTRAIAKAAAAHAHVWVAQTKDFTLPPPTAVQKSWKVPFFFDIAEVDLAWGATGTRPDVALEVKGRSKAGISQDHYMFLSDVVALAGEKLHSGTANTTTFAAAYIAPSSAYQDANWLPALASQTGRMTLTLEPAAANKSLPGTHDIYWADPSKGTYTLDHRGGISKLLTGTTGGRLRGVFHRPGVLKIECGVESGFLKNGLWCILYTITDAALAMAKADDWWP